MAGQSVFANPYTQGTQVWSTQGAKVFISSASNAAQNGGSEGSDSKQTTGMIACLTGVNVQLARTLADQYPLGTGGIIRLVGAPQGTATFTSLLGPTSTLKNFIKQISDLCKPVDIIIQPVSKAVCQKQGESSNANEQQITLIQCTANNIQVQIQQAQQGLSMVSVPVTVQFTNMTWD